jgi:hypothetical protein
MLVIGSDGKGSWTKDFLTPLFKRTFPHTKIMYDTEQTPDIVIRSHFHTLEKEPAYTCPYIVWSGESYRVKHKHDYSPILEINTVNDYSIQNNLYIPHIIAEFNSIITRPTQILPKKNCCAYTFSNRVPERERFFWAMRIKEPTCFAFGASCHTRDNPFELPMNRRGENSTAFKDFGFLVAMENKIAPGYLTEKIGYAYNSGTVPIYWGDSETVSTFFNPASYIDVSNYTNPDKAAEYALEVWRDPQKLQKYLDAPITLNSMLEDYFAIYTDYRLWQKPFVDILRETFPDLS